MNLKELDIKTLKSHARQVNIKIRQEHKEETKAKVKEMRKETSEKIKAFKAKRTEELKAKLIPLNRQGKKAMIEHLEPHKDKIKEGDNIKMTVTEADDEGEETKDYGKSKQKPYKGKVMSVKGIPTESEIDRLWEESKKAPVPPEITKQDFVKVAKSKPTVKPLHNCNKCGKGSYTPTCVKCMRKELAAEDLKNAVKVPSIKITEAEDEGEKDKETKSTQEPYKGKVKKIKGIPKDPEKIKEKYAKKEGGGKPPSEPQEYITIYKNGKPVRMRRRDKKPKAEATPKVPAEAPVDEGKAARIEAEKKKRALKDAETEARLAARSAKKAAGKKIKPAEMLAAAKKKRSQLTKLIAKVQDIKMSAKDKEKFENLKERFDNDEEDFEKDYSFLQRIKNKIREPKDKADSPAPAPEQGPRNLKKGFGIKRLPKPAEPTPEVPAPKARQYIEQFSGSEGVKDLVDEAYPGLKKKQQRVKFNQLAGYFRNVRNENSTEKEILEEEIEDPDEKELFKYLIRNNIFMGAAEYNKKKKQQDKDQAKFNAQFEADRHALDFHNA
tara:strand:- start:254 stop:1912 length:1659 start_codon:yes stop_codon:yes gene_type:complete